MPRRFPTKIIDVTGKVDKTPNTCVGEYLASKKSSRSSINPPNLDSIDDSIESFYINERLEHEKYSKAFKDQENHRQQQSLVSLHRIQKTTRDCDELHARFIKVNSFIREFGEKKKEARKKIQNEIENHKKLGKEIDSKIEKLNELKIFRKTLTATVNSYAIYETVLNNAAKIMRCPSPQTLINRCDAIVLVQDNVMELNAEKMKSIENMHNRIKQITKHAAMVFEGLMNELKLTHRNYAKAKQECFRWEVLLSKAQDQEIDRSKKIELASSGLLSIYNMLCKRRHIRPTFVRGNVEGMCDFIKNEVEIMQGALNEFHNPTI